MKKTKSSEVLTESDRSAGDAGSAGNRADGDVFLVRFQTNGKVEALDRSRRPIEDLRGHSMSKWSLIRERLADDFKLVLMDHGHERAIDVDFVPQIQRWT